MTCEQCRSLVDDYVDATLAPGDRAQVEAHLVECDACRAMATDFAEIRHAARALDARVPPPHVWTRLSASYAAEPRAKGWRLWRPDFTGWRPLAAAATLIVLVGALSRLGVVQNPILPIYREREVGFVTRQTGAKVLAVPGEWNGFDFEAMARGIEESMRDDHVRSRVGQVEYLGGLLQEWGIPIVLPIGGHAVFLDARRFYPAMPQDEFPAQSLAEVPIRDCDSGVVAFGGEDAHQPAPGGFAKRVQRDRPPQVGFRRPEVVSLAGCLAERFQRGEEMSRALQAQFPGQAAASMAERVK